MSDTTASAAPAQQGAALYDIGAFLAGGLNMDLDQARAFVDRLRGQTRHIERDQEQSATINGDTLVDLIDGFDRLVAMWEDDTHVAVVGDEGWSIEHSLRCRASGNMAGCPYHKYTAQRVSLAALMFPDPGRFLMTLEGEEFIDGGVEMKLEPLP